MLLHSDLTEKYKNMYKVYLYNLGIVTADKST